MTVRAREEAVMPFSLFDLPEDMLACITAELVPVEEDCEEWTKKQARDLVNLARTCRWASEHFEYELSEFFNVEWCYHCDVKQGDVMLELGYCLKGLTRGFTRSGTKRLCGECAVDDQCSRCERTGCPCRTIRDADMDYCGGCDQSFCVACFNSKYGEECSRCETAYVNSDVESWTGEDGEA